MLFKFMQLTLHNSIAKNLSTIFKKNQRLNLTSITTDWGIWAIKIVHRNTKFYDLPSVFWTELNIAGIPRHENKQANKQNLGKIIKY